MLIRFINIWLCIIMLDGVSEIKAQAIISGKVTDKVTREVLVGASVVDDQNKGVITDRNGFYQIETKQESGYLRFDFLGYQKVIKRFTIDEDTLILNVAMHRKTEDIDEIVISESKYEQKISEVTVSMSVLKPDEIENNNETSLDNALQKISGLEIKDGQSSIRGGSGYSYGAGSRVLLLLNDLPLLSADAADVKWNFLPVENIAQIEIIKGASSVLYGSSALNGAINFRTAFAKTKPETKANLLAGVYLKPKRKELVWWNRQRFFTGFDFLHTRKIGNSDVVVGGHAFDDRGYRENEWERRGRLNLSYFNRSEKIKGLSYGMSVNSMLMNKIDFFLWQDADSGAYRQNDEAITELSGLRLTLDPMINYYGNNHLKHSLKSRFFIVDNQYKEDTAKNSTAQSVYVEYKLVKKFGNGINLVAGMAEKSTAINAKLYGNHSGNELAFYTQLDKTIAEKLKFLFGFRIEQYKLDGNRDRTKPIFRSGANYQLFEYTHLRASFGQAYRYPSVAEKYTSTMVSSLRIFPNPALKPEEGWSAELGIMQGFKIKHWQLMFDAAAYYSRYKDMIEFQFGIFAPGDVIPTWEHIGFSSMNVNNTLIKGIDVSLQGKREINNWSYTAMAGYTYSHPVDLDYTSDSVKNGEILKYRNLHIAKTDLQIEFKQFKWGTYLSYHSKMVNVDSVFMEPILGTMILPGFDDYWENRNNDYMVVDFRMAYAFSEKSQLNFTVKNLFNKEYLIRPGDISPPRRISLKYSLKF